MNIIGYYTGYMIDRAADAVHKNSRAAAAYLEAQDEKDFGASSIGALNGMRFAKVYYRDPDSRCGSRSSVSKTFKIGVTAEKIKILQRLELQYAIAKKAESMSESSKSLGIFHDIGSLITPTLRIGSTREISSQYSEEALSVIQKRSENCKDTEYYVSNNEKYLAKEMVVQDEGMRLFERADKTGASESFLTKLTPKDVSIQNAVNNAAQDLVVNRVTNNGKALSAALGLGTAALAWRYFSK